jgi:hypothetical protein
MGRKKKPKCGCSDCFNCPYDDCIVEDVQPKQSGPGRPRLPDGLVHQHQLEYARKHYQAHKEERKLLYKEYYQKNKARIQAQQKAYRERRNMNEQTKSKEYAGNTNKGDTSQC